MAVSMGRLYCRCLNVVVHHSGEVETGRLLSAVTLLPEHSKDPLVGQQLLELGLDVAGVVMVSCIGAVCHLMQYPDTLDQAQSIIRQTDDTQKSIKMFLYYILC